MTPLKPWNSFEDQLAKLKARGLHVDDDAAALRYLARIGYYRLNGYLYPLREIDAVVSTQKSKPIRLDSFIAGSRFEDVVKLYVFDKKLRLLALDALERIEMAVRVDVAHLLGQRDPCAHEKPDCLHGKFTKKKGGNADKTEHQLWLEKYRESLKRAKREPFVAHHQQKYDGKLPVWVAIELWDFGLLSKLFAGMRFEDQQAIAAKYGAADGKALANWLRGLNFMRNVAAHHSRMWNINVLEAAPLPTGWPAMPNTKPFFYLCLIQQLLRTICPHSSWGHRLATLLEKEFPAMPNRAVTLEDLGVCGNWGAWDLWRHK